MTANRAGSSSSRRSWLDGLFGPLADRPFRLFWLSATTSSVGSAFVPVALAFAVLGIGGDATSLGLVLLVGTVAGLASSQSPASGRTGCRDAT